MRKPLWIKVLGDNGAPDDRGVLSSIYASDLSGEPIGAEFRVTGQGLLECFPAVAQPVALHVVWDIEGFGRIYATTDNGGHGYLAGRDGTVHLNHGLAHSRLRRTERRLEELQGIYRFGPDVLQKVQEARALLGSAEAARTSAERVRLNGKAHGLAAWALEEIEVSKARQDVARMPDERRRSFRFGCNPFAHFRSEEYRRRFVELFDFATLPFYRNVVEGREGRLDWRFVDELLEWLGATHVVPKGHPLYWGHDDFVPLWMKRLDRVHAKQAIARQVQDTVARYRSRISIWDIVNEAHDLPGANAFSFTQEEQLGLTEAAAKSVAKADPSAVRIVNCTALWAEYVAWSNGQRPPMSPYRYLEELIERGVPFEVAGLQMYYPSRDMADISAVLDRYAKLGKPIHITELGTPSGRAESLPSLNPGAGSAVQPAMHPIEHYWQLVRPPREEWWHDRWNQAVQADWVEQFYLIAASKPAVEAITWWDLSDGCSFMPYGGLLDDMDEPKESYYRLEGVVKSIKGADFRGAPEPAESRNTDG